LTVKSDLPLKLRRPPDFHATPGYPDAEEAVSSEAERQRVKAAAMLLRYLRIMEGFGD
jgi:hypothetical protein